MIFLASTELESAYEIVEKVANWQVLEIYEVRGKVLADIKRFYEQNIACVRVAGNVSSCFNVNNSLGQKSEKYPWLFSIYMDRVVKNVYERTKGF